MPNQVCNGATMMCSFAVPPGTSSLIVLPVAPTLKNTFTDNQPDANIMDHVPIMNIPPFGMCIAPTNPAFIAATAAALGTPTPVPCVPLTPMPWVTGAISPPVNIGYQPALDNVSQLMCTWLGVITFVTPGEFTVNIP